MRNKAKNIFLFDAQPEESKTSIQGENAGKNVHFSFGCGTGIGGKRLVRL